MWDSESAGNTGSLDIIRLGLFWLGLVWFVELSEIHLETPDFMETLKNCCDHLICLHFDLLFC
jgi:hypothetical protein